VKREFRLGIVVKETPIEHDVKKTKKERSSGPLPWGQRPVSEGGGGGTNRVLGCHRPLISQEEWGVGGGPAWTAKPGRPVLDVCDGAGLRKPTLE